MDLSIPIQKRNFVRHPAKPGAMATLIWSDEQFYSRIGQIVDISKGGLAFQYISNENHVNGHVDLEIFSWLHPVMYLKQLPFTVVYDRKVQRGHRKSPAVRRCGLKFGALSEDQTTRLDAFISAYTISATPRRRRITSLKGLNEADKQSKPVPRVSPVT